MNQTHTTRLAQLATSVLLAATLALTACGGGGGGAAGPSTPTPAAPTCPAGQTEMTAPTWNGSAWVGQVCASTPVVASTGTLTTSVSTATYADNSLQQSAFNALNLVRKNAGAGLVSQHAALDTSAGAHAKYLTTNIATAFTVNAHTEDPSKPDFYEATVGMRMAKAGFSVGSYWTEVIGGTGASRQGSDCVLGLLGTVYHAAALLSQATNVGIGFGTDTANIPMCVVDLGSQSNESYPQVAPSGQIVAYPYDGQTGLFYSFDIAFEVPRPPVALFPNATSGTPVIVNIRNADFVNYKAAGTLNAVVSKFEMKDANGNLVPVGILASPGIGAANVSLTSDGNLGEGFVVLVPIAPLNKGGTYSVTFAATLKAGGSSLSKTWHFVADRDR
ncbi:hypothetical protein QRD43_20865 [Pelomonas sp. APW6]|uniref:SCP domain-containing protein n=1 Tax=Roseateles subflavus TaxID=3053353 RepID=A0ABT7LNC5_9BURK|nr:hypothetical protein [Pelomonas sp. APW6]MDL5034367.1 hypothetical protein [Pelomonas sp. APW6]